MEKKVTEWQSDVAKRSHHQSFAQLLRLLQFHTPIFLTGTSALAFLLHRLYSEWSLSSVLSSQGNHSDYAWICLAFIPSLISVFCFSFPIYETRFKSDLETPKRTLRRLCLCLVTRGSNVDAVIRVCQNLRNLQQLDERIVVYIVTDEPADQSFKGLGVKVLGTPASFQPKKAMYKARALEWFRQSVGLSDDDWVLHLDEETNVDEHTIEACFKFVEERVEFDYGQGVILYNAHNYWSNPLLTVADVSRVRDDLGKFYFAHNFVNVPIFGIHGSFLLIRGCVENSVTWDTDSLVEDFWFGLQAWDQGYRGGWIPAAAREQSPQTLRDFVKQRQRWFCGMLALPGWPGKLQCLTWCVNGLAIPTLLMIQHYVEMPRWIYWLSLVCGSGDLFSLMLSCFYQDLDAGIRLPALIIHQIVLCIFGIGAGMLEATVVLYSLLRPTKSFHVIKK